MIYISLLQVGTGQASRCLVAGAWGRRLASGSGLSWLMIDDVLMLMLMMLLMMLILMLLLMMMCLCWCLLWWCFDADVGEDVLILMLMLMLAIFLDLFFFFVLGGPEWGFHWRPCGFSLSGGKQILPGITMSNRGGQGVEIFMGHGYIHGRP